MTESAITFRCGSDDLLGILHHGEGGERDLGVLIVVGGPQYRVGSHRQFVLMARSLAAAGFPVFRFDVRGMGDSSGEPRSFENISDDIRAAIDRFHAATPSIRGVIVFGLCDAASAALMYCSSDDRLRGLILANPWVRTQVGEAQAFVRHYYGRRVMQRSFWAKVVAGEVHLVASIRSFLASVRRSRTAPGGVAAFDLAPFLQRMEAGMRAFAGPILVLVSDRDLTAREFEELTRQSPAWGALMADEHVLRRSVFDSDHTFSSTGSLNTCNAAIHDWLRDQFGNELSPHLTQD